MIVETKSNDKIYKLILTEAERNALAVEHWRLNGLRLTYGTTHELIGLLIDHPDD